MQPTTRKEFYLAKLAGESVEIPPAITREETYLAYLCGSDIEPPMPITADEMYLAAMCGMVDGYPFPFTNLQHIWADLIETGQTSVIPITREEYYWTTIDLYSIIYSTETGPIVSFTAKRAHPLHQLSVAIEPVQDLNGYANPWPAGGGANQWDEQWESGSIGGADGQPTSDDTRIRSKNFNACLPSTQYYCLNPLGAINIAFYDADKAYISMSGNATNVTFTTPANCYFFKLRVVATSYLSGLAINYPASVRTYSPNSNICPITGWTEAKVWRTGVNIWDEQTEDGYITTTGVLAPYANAIRSKNYTPCKPNEKYVHHHKQGMNGCTIAWYDESKTFIQRDSVDSSDNVVVTTPGNAYYFKLSFYNYKAQDAPTYNNDVSINYPSTDHDYHAYSGDTYTIDLDGTRYGGTLDVLTGVLTIDRAYLEFDGSADESWNTWSGNRAYYVRLSDIPAYPVASMICNSFKWKGRSNLSSGCVIGDFLANANAQGGNWDGNISFFYDDLAGGLANFKTWMGSNPIQIVYTLQTPITVQLTAQQVSSLAGTNVLFADAGNVTVEYRES